MFRSLDFVLVGVRQHGQESGTLDGCVQLALIDRARASQTSWNDFSIFCNEVTQSVNVFVVDFFNASDRETAKPFALEQQRLGVALWALVFVEFFESGHVGLLGNCLV
jgi:hypothetical protein